MSNTPNIAAPLWDAAQSSPWIPHNKGFRIFDALAGAAMVEDRDLTAPPVSCADGARYLIKAPATGLWATHDGEMAVAVGTNASSGWYFVTVAIAGMLIWVRDEAKASRYYAAAWHDFTEGLSRIQDMSDVDLTGLADGYVLRWDASNGLWYVGPESNIRPTESIIIACSDEATALTAGAGKTTFRMPYKFTLTAIRCSLTTAQTSNGAGGIFTVDVNEGGVSILSTKLTIDNGEKSSKDAAAQPVISDASLADDAEMSVDIDQIGDGTAKGLKVILIGYRG